MYESKRQYHYGTGRRKSSVARVRVYENGTGSITINGRDIDDYFGLETLKLLVRQPLVTTDTLGRLTWLSPSPAAASPARPAHPSWRRPRPSWVSTPSTALPSRPPVS